MRLARERSLIDFISTVFASKKDEVKTSRQHHMGPKKEQSRPQNPATILSLLRLNVEVVSHGRICASNKVPLTPKCGVKAEKVCTGHPSSCMVAQTTRRMNRRLTPGKIRREETSLAPSTGRLCICNRMPSGGFISFCHLRHVQLDWLTPESILTRNLGMEDIHITEGSEFRQHRCLQL